MESTKLLEAKRRVLKVYRENPLGFEWLALAMFEFDVQFYRLAFKITQNREMAEDAVQEAGVSVLKSIDDEELTNLDNPLGLLFTAVKNKAIDVLRKEKLRRCEELTDYNYPDGSIDALGQMIAEEDLRTILSMADQLSSQCRAVFLSWYQLGASRGAQAELAQLLNTSESNVSQHLSHARGILKDKFDQRSRDEEYAADSRLIRKGGSIA